MSEIKQKLFETAVALTLAGLWAASFIRLGDRIARDVIPPLMLSFMLAILWGAVMGWILAWAYVQLKLLVSETRKHST